MFVTVGQQMTWKSFCVSRPLLNCRLGEAGALHLRSELVSAQSTRCPSTPRAAGVHVYIQNST